jgi:hypothetical protein
MINARYAGVVQHAIRRVLAPSELANSAEDNRDNQRRAHARRVALSAHELQ